MKAEDFLTQGEFVAFYQTVQQAVLEICPEASPKISHEMLAWQAPASKKHSGKILLYAVARQSWFGLYLKATVMKDLASRIHERGYETSGGAVHVPFNSSLEALAGLTKWLVRETLTYFEEETR